MNISFHILEEINKIVDVPFLKWGRGGGTLPNNVVNNYVYNLIVVSALRLLLNMYFPCSFKHYICFSPNKSFINKYIYLHYQPLKPYECLCF